MPRSDNIQTFPDLDALAQHLVRLFRLRGSGQGRHPDILPPGQRTGCRYQAGSPALLQLPPGTEGRGEPRADIRR